MKPAQLVQRPAHVPAELVVDFDIYETRTGLTPVQDWWLQLRDSNPAPVVWTPHNGGHWVPLRGAQIREILTDPERFSSEAGSVPKKNRSQRFLPISLDPPEHQGYRAILNPIVAPRPVRDQEERIRALVVELIERFQAHGGCDFVADFAKQIPAGVVLGMADLPLSDAVYLADAFDEVTRQTSPENTLAAIVEITDYFRPVAKARRGGPGADVITRITSGKVDGEMLSEDDGLGMVIQFVGAGLDTTASLLGFAILYLAQNPERLQELVDDPQLVTSAATEMVRRFPLATVGRLVTRDLDFHGVAFKAGDMITCPTALINFDEALFSDPLAVDFRRPLIQHNTFGDGAHRCPGAILARTEFRIALEEWVRRIPKFELDADTLTFRNGVVASIERLPLRWPAQQTA